MVPRRDIQQWDNACREVGIFGDDVHRASDDFHAEKRANSDGFTTTVQRPETGPIGRMEI